MPPRRRRSTVTSTFTSKPSAGLNPPTLHGECSEGTALNSSHHPDSQVLPVMGTSFEFEDFNEWWTSPPAVVLPAVDSFTEQEQSSYDDVMEPLLVFPDEEVQMSQSTLQGICSEAAPAVSPQVLASPHVAPVRKQRGSAKLGVDKKGKVISPRESHILSERQRRKGMNHLFTTLGSLLPDTFTKSDKSTIVSEIIVYIQSLQKDLEELGTKRSEALKESSSRPGFNRTDSSASLNSNCTTVTGTHSRDGASTKKLLEMQPGSGACPNVVTSFCGSDTFINISSPKLTRSLFSGALEVLQRHRIQLLDANISSNPCMVFYYFHVKALNEELSRDDTLLKELQKLTAPDPMAA